MSIKEEKAALRREIKQRIRALSKEDIKSQSISACKLAAGLIAFKNARTILSYRALPGECDPAELVKAAASMGKNASKKRYFTAWRSSELLPEGKYSEITVRRPKSART